jgi:hypothetical protein
MGTLINILKRSRQRPPYNPGERELFSIRTPKPAQVWKGTHWITALSLCNAFARVVAHNGGVSLSLEITQHQAGRELDGPIVCDLSYQFADSRTMRRIMTFNPQITGVGDSEVYVIDIPV